METPRHWRLKKQRLGLVGEICPHCEALIFPPRDVCPECGEEAKTPFYFSGKGEVYSFTTMLNGPSGFEEYAPYVVALIQLEEGPVLTAQMTDVEPDDVFIGMPVEMVTRKLRTDAGDIGTILYSYKFRPRFIHKDPQIVQ